MKFPSSVAAVLLMLSAGVASAQSPSPEPISPSPTPAAASPLPSASPTATVDDEQLLLTIEQEWCNACLHGDADYLAKLFTDDFVVTNSRAEMNTKAQELQETRDRVVHYTVFENREMTVHLHGDAAFVTGRTRLKGTVAATGKALDAEVQFTDMFARIDGRWRAIAAHVSRVGGE